MAASARVGEIPVSSARRVLLAIIILGAALRLFQLGAESFWFDEAYLSLIHI